LSLHPNSAAETNKKQMGIRSYQTPWFFTTQRYASTAYAVTVCPSVCVTHSENTENHDIIEFVKETHFFNLLYCWLTQVVPDKIQQGCKMVVCVCVCVCVYVVLVFLCVWCLLYTFYRS